MPKGLLRQAAPDDMQAMAGANENAPQGEPASPEEQQQYERFVDNALQLIYSDQTLPNVLKRLQGLGEGQNGTDPIEGLAQTAVMIVGGLQESAAKDQVQLTPDVLFHGGVAIIEDLAELASKAKIHDYDEKEIEGALYRAMDLYREQHPVDQEGLKQDFEALRQADASGELDAKAPGLKEHFTKEQGGGA